MKLTVDSLGPPPGSYSAEFVGIQETSHDEYGPGYRWEYRIVGGEHDGEIASRITSTKPTMRNACGKMLSGLTGRRLQANEAIELDELVGRRFLIVVAETENGGVRIESVISPPKDS